jgi:hypothetical protein
LPIQWLHLNSWRHDWLGNKIGAFKNSHHFNKTIRALGALHKGVFFPAYLPTLHLPQLIHTASAEYQLSTSKDGPSVGATQNLSSPSTQVVSIPLSQCFHSETRKLCFKQEI